MDRTRWLDTWVSSNRLFGAVQIHGGKENVLDNNTFIDCKHALSAPVLLMGDEP